MKYCLMGVADQKLGKFTQPLPLPDLHLWYCIMQFSQIEFDVLLPDVEIEESGLYGIRQVQVLILVKHHAAVEKMGVCVTVF